MYFLLFNADTSLISKIPHFPQFPLYNNNYGQLSCFWSGTNCFPFFVEGVLSSVVAIFYLASWQLGAVEAISLSILVGTSVDYCVHLVEGYIMAENAIPTALTSPKVSSSYSFFGLSERNPPHQYHRKCMDNSMKINYYACWSQGFVLFWVCVCDLVGKLKKIM